MIKVAIVEDDTKVRESLPIVINGTPGFTCVGACPSAEDALKQLPRHWPDVLLMDVNLPGMSGIECVSKLKAQRPALQIIMLTSSDDSETIFDSLMAGASGYLVKQTSPAEIIEALADVHRGASPMSGSIARKVVQYFQQKKKTEDEGDKLSGREREILSLLSQGFQYKEIGDQLSISPLTVRSHLRNIYEKLHVNSRTEAVMKFFGQQGTV